MKKIVITGSSTYGVNNMGDDSMLACMVQGVRRHWDNPEIVFICRHPNEQYDQAFGFTSVKNIDHDSREESIGRFFLGMNEGDSTAHLAEIKNQIETADLLLIGGNSFMEICKNEFLRGVSTYAATLGTLAKFCETPFGLYGLNVVDDIRDPTTKEHAKFLISNAIHTTVRETKTLEYLSDIGIESSKISVCGDPAYGMEYDQRINPHSVLEKCGISIDYNRPLVGVALRQEYWTGEEADFHAKTNHVARVLDRFSLDCDVDLLLIPNCTYTAAHLWQDDRVAHRKLFELMSEKNRVKLVEEQLSVFETYSLFSLLDFHISNRRHSCIFAAMNLVPFLSLSGSLAGHMSPFLLDLSLPRQIADMTDEKDFSAKMLHTWEDRKNIKNILLEKIPELQAVARTNISRILDSF